MRDYCRSFAKKTCQQKTTTTKKIGILFALFTMNAHALPTDFVYLQDVDSSILQDMRYASKHNFVGRPIQGYKKPQCILTKEAALALANVQKELQQSSLSLKVYDCYRPTDAVADFLAWSKLPKQDEMKAEFYPNTNKADLFKLGYIAEHSGHSRGSTIDLTIVPIPNLKQPNYRPGEKLVNCTAPYLQRYRDDSIDMGSGYDCLDKAANVDDPNVSLIANRNRHLLRDLMTKYGFTPYDTEWWHFTLENEPYPKQDFNFTVK